MARQIKRFKVLYSAFFSLTSDILQADLVPKYNISIVLKYFYYENPVFFIFIFVYIAI
jgi:hypothetical protein